MNVHLPAPRSKWPGRLVNLAVVVVVLALAGATFVVSYTGVHAVAVQAGVSTRFAPLYPGLFDAVLVIACVAAVALRDARWWARWYAWLVIVVVVAAVGATDAVHAMNVTLPHRKTEGVVAAVPWVLVLLGFSLMLTVLRQSRAQHASAAPAPALPPAPAPESRAGEEDFTPESAGAREEPSALEQPAAGEAASSPDEPAAEELAPTRADPVATDADASVPPAADRKAAEVSADAEQGGAPAGVDSAPEAPASTAAQEPVLARPEQAPDQGTERGPIDSGLIAPPHGYWGADAEDEPREHDYPSPPEIDQDAPPFATAPFATVPRLNRVRATPIPPEDDED